MFNPPYINNSKKILGNVSEYECIQYESQQPEW